MPGSSPGERWAYHSSRSEIFASEKRESRREKASLVPFLRGATQAHGPSSICSKSCARLTVYAERPPQFSNSFVAEVVKALPLASAAAGQLAEPARQRRRSPRTPCQAASATAAGVAVGASWLWNGERAVGWKESGRAGETLVARRGTKAWPTICRQCSHNRVSICT